MSHSVGVVGPGKMGRTIIEGLKAKTHSPQIWASARTAEACIRAEAELGIPVPFDYSALLPATEILILCVRPKDIRGVCQSLADAGTLPPSTIIVSVAAGESTAAIEKAILPLKNPVIRAMPNTLCSIGQGMTIICPGSNVNSGCIRAVIEVFSAIGRCIHLDERHMDAATAISASGPAFVYTFIEALTQAGVKLGLAPQAALDMIAQCLIGSGEMVRQSNKHPAVLREEVTTPGGCTIAGVLALEERAFRAIVSNAVITAASVASTLATSR